MKWKVLALAVCFAVCIFCSAGEVFGEYLSEETSAEIESDISPKVQTRVNKIKQDIGFYRNEKELSAENLSGKLLVILTNKRIITVDNKDNVRNEVNWADIYYCSYNSNILTFFGEADNRLMNLNLTDIVDVPKRKPKADIDEIGEDKAKWFTETARTAHIAQISDDASDNNNNGKKWWKYILQYMGHILIGILTALGGLIVLLLRKKLKIE